MGLLATIADVGLGFAQCDPQPATLAAVHTTTTTALDEAERNLWEWIFKNLCVTGKPVPDDILQRHLRREYPSLNATEAAAVLAALDARVASYWGKR